MVQGAQKAPLEVVTLAPSFARRTGLHERDYMRGPGATVGLGFVVTLAPAKLVEGMMPRGYPCPVCHHPGKGRIDAAILARIGDHRVAEEYEDLTKVNTLEHRYRCLYRLFRPWLEGDKDAA
jgi:hypothetical protein